MLNADLHHKTEAAIRAASPKILGTPQCPIQAFSTFSILMQYATAMATSTESAQSASVATTASTSPIPRRRSWRPCQAARYSRAPDAASVKPSAMLAWLRYLGGGR